MTHVRFGAAAVKSRFSRSPARTLSLAGIVVRMPLLRRMPDRPSARIARSTLPGETEGILRASRAVIFGRPYRPSGVSRRRPAGSVVQARSRTVSITNASCIVRSATWPPDRHQVR